MAKIIKKSHSLERKHSGYLTVTALSYLISLACFIAFVIKCIFDIRAGWIDPIPTFLLIAGFIIFGSIGRYMIEKTKSVKAGFKGENITAGIIAGLPQRYFGFQNIEITLDGKTSEIDMVVIGPTGVFIIETKNLNGHISGSYQDTQWVQNKTGRGGTPYSRKFYSPVRQVGTHVYRLAHYLRKNGIKAHIDSVVYFANDGSEVDISGRAESCPVFSAADDGKYKLTYYITHRPETLSADSISKICALLTTKASM